MGKSSAVPGNSKTFKQTAFVVLCLGAAAVIVAWAVVDLTTRVVSWYRFEVDLSVKTAVALLTSWLVAWVARRLGQGRHGREVTKGDGRTFVKAATATPPWLLVALPVAALVAWASFSDGVVTEVDRTGTTLYAFVNLLAVAILGVTWGGWRFYKDQQPARPDKRARRPAPAIDQHPSTPQSLSLYDAVVQALARIVRRKQ